MLNKILFILSVLAISFLIGRRFFKDIAPKAIAVVDINCRVIDMREHIDTLKDIDLLSEHITRIEWWKEKMSGRFIVCEDGTLKQVAAEFSIDLPEISYIKVDLILTDKLIWLADDSFAVDVNLMHGNDSTKKLQVVVSNIKSKGFEIQLKHFYELSHEPVGMFQLLV